MSSTYTVSRPVAWGGGVILLALIVLAIVLPITLRKEEDVYHTQVQRFIDLFEPFASKNSPYNFVEEDAKVTRAQATFNKMDSTQKRGYANVFPAWSGIQTGPPVGDHDDLEEMIKKGEVGAFLNFVEADDIRQIQTWATEGDLANPLMLGFDVIHGYASIAPVNLGMASAFDPDLIYRHAEWAAKEAAAVGINWNFNPMLDVGRDPRWGRVSEGSGEDAYLVGTLGAAYIKGYQDHGMAACVKHIGAYGVTRGGRDYSAGEIGRLHLFNEYFEAYKRAFKAKPLTAMASFNTIFRNPSHGNRELLQDILRGMWGFDGFVVADWAGASDMMGQRTIARGDITAAGERSLWAGVDMNMSDDVFYEGLKDSLNKTSPSGKTYAEHLDLAVQRILSVKERMGLYENHMPTGEKLPFNEAMEVAREAAEKAAVLLKNAEVDGAKVLPLAKDAARGIWLVGKISDTPRDHQGSWSSSGIPFVDDVITVRAEFEERAKPVGPTELNRYYPGYETTWKTDDEEWEAVNTVLDAFDAAATKPDTIVFVVGENANQSGEGTSRTNLTMSGLQLNLVQEIYERNQKLPENDRSKLVYVVMAGRPLAITWEKDHMDAILYAWNNGSKGGPALWNLLFGDKSPSGKLPITIPRSVGQVPINYQFKGTRSQVGRDLWDTVLDPHFCLWGTDEQDRYDWGGRCYMSHYIDSPIGPLYWFGYGLSYAEFTYSNPTLSQTSFDSDEVMDHPKLTVGVTVQRTGGRRDIDTTEIVQVYVRDVKASVMPAWKNLRGYKRVDFAANGPDSQTVSFELDVTDDFGFWNEQMEWVVEPGKFEIIVGASAYDEDHVLTVNVVDKSGKANLPLGARAD